MQTQARHPDRADTAAAADAGIADIVAGRFTLIDGPQDHARPRERLAARLDAFATMQRGSRHPR